MAEQRMKVRDKKVQKMTKDGLVEENLTDKSSVRVSNRASDVQMGRKQGEKEENLVDKSPRQSERSGKNIRPSVQKSRDAPELIRTEKQSEDFGQSSKQQNRKRIRAEVGKESRLAEKSKVGQLGRLKDKRADLSENRGDSRRNQIRMESISAIRNRKKKPKSFLMKKQERKRKQSSIPRKHRSIRQMKENLLERKNPV